MSFITEHGMWIKVAKYQVHKLVLFQYILDRTDTLTKFDTFSLL